MTMMLQAAYDIYTGGNGYPQLTTRILFVYMITLLVLFYNFLQKDKEKVRFSVWRRSIDLTLRGSDRAAGQARQAGGQCRCGDEEEQVDSEEGAEAGVINCFEARP